MQINCKYTWLGRCCFVCNSVAGADYQFDEKGIQLAIREASFEPYLRNQAFESVEKFVFAG